jgi:hypothetical protein
MYVDIFFPVVWANILLQLTYPTQQEQHEEIRLARERFRMASGSRGGGGGGSTPQRPRARVFVDDDRVTIHNYPPAIWNEEDYDEDEEEEIDYDEEGGDIHAREGINNSVDVLVNPSGHGRTGSEDDGMDWDDE